MFRRHTNSIPCRAYGRSCLTFRVVTIWKRLTVNSGRGCIAQTTNYWLLHNPQMSNGKPNASKARLPRRRQFV